MQVEAAQRQGPALIVKLSGVCDRDQASALVGSEIAVHRRDLPEPEADRFYWSDLEGLTVRTLDGQSLGRVERLFETGANDVLVVRGERERLLPFAYGTVVRQVDLNAGEIRVDWDPDF
jgi:16S rRNA processing protein RimM